MSRWTEAQFRAVLAWLVAQWNEPNRSDHYLMQIAAYVAQAPGGTALSNFKIPFRELGGDGKPVRRGGDPNAPGLKEQVSELSRSLWFSRMTKPVKTVRAAEAPNGRG